MITMPDPIKKYFKIINEETIVLRPPLSKILPQCAFVFGLPIIMFLIVFADGFDRIHPPTFFLVSFFTLVIFGYGYFIAVPGLRGRITIDLKNRIIKTERGRYRDILDDCSFDNAAFSYDHDFLVTPDAAITFNRIYFHNKKEKYVFYALSLKDDSAEYHYMLDFLEEICLPIKSSNRTL